MEPLPETRDVLRTMSLTSQTDLVDRVGVYAEWVVEAIPGCVGLSVTLRDHELTFTWLATDDRVRSLDAAQFLDDGPCEWAAYRGTELDVPDLMDERDWRLLALAGAAVGVRSSLSLPLQGLDGPIGSVNLYGRDSETFAGRERRIALAFGADVRAAVMNADLSMASRQRAEHAAETLQTIDRIDIATGILAEKNNIPVTEAMELLRAAADRADVPLPVLADLVVTCKHDEV